MAKAFCFIRHNGDGNAVIGQGVGDHFSQQLVAFYDEHVHRCVAAKSRR
jgi:hypothetical protein